jgi:hypothetical protein
MMGGSRSGSVHLTVGSGSGRPIAYESGSKKLLSTVRYPSHEEILECNAQTSFLFVTYCFDFKHLNKNNHIFVIKISKAVKMFGLDPDPEPKEIFTDRQNWSF